MLATVTEYLRAEAAAVTSSAGASGYIAGVYHNGEQTVIANGLANIATGVPMTEDTGFLLGSVTKVLTTTLLLRHVERGHIDLDERVSAYLPQFKLASPACAEEIRVRHLLNHTDGIDGDLFFPEAKGPDALRFYVEQIARCGTLFNPGECVSYSNPAFLVAGRLLEVVTGKCFHDLIEREIYGRVGMHGSSTSVEQAVLRRTAVGHFYDAAAQAIRPTSMFMLPESWSASGSTLIVTIPDLLAFARTHLAHGVAPSGEPVLSREFTQRMRTATHDMNTPNLPPIGLGWWLAPFGETTTLWHGGGSPGGSSYLLVLPKQDFAFAAFSNGPSAAALHDKLALWLLREHLHLNVPDVVAKTIAASDVAAYEGTYRSHQLRVDIKAIDGQLEQTLMHEPIDAVQERILTQFSGGQFPGPPLRFVPVGPGLFAPAGLPLDSFTGVKGRTSLMSFHKRKSGAAHRIWTARLPRRSA